MINEVDGIHVLFLVLLISGKLSSWKRYWSFKYTRLVDFQMFYERKYFFTSAVERMIYFENYNDVGSHTESI